MAMFKDRFAGNSGNSRLVQAPHDCEHGNGLNCECQLPHYKGLFAVYMSADPEDAQFVGHWRIVRMKRSMDGGMREFICPTTGETVGSCGAEFPNDDNNVMTLEAYLATHWRWP